MRLTVRMKRVFEEQALGFVATVSSDGTPNLSPKGTTSVWDDEHLVFCTCVRLTPSRTSPATRAWRSTSWTRSSAKATGSRGPGAS